MSPCRPGAWITAVTILWIIGPALGIHHLQSHTDVLRLALGRLSTGPRIMALVFVHA